MRVPISAIGSAGVGLVFLAITLLGVPRPLLWVLLVLGFALIAVAALFTWEASTKQKEREASFPDVEIEVTSQGRHTVPHPMIPSGLPQVAVAVAVYGLKLVNHEAQRKAALSFHLFQDLDLNDGAPPEVVCSPFKGDHPQGKHSPPVLHMPVNLAPKEATSGDVMFELSDWGGQSKLIPTRLEIRDALSGTKFEIPPHIGRHRPAHSP